MKKILALVMAAAMALSLAACGGAASSAPARQPASQPASQAASQPDSVPAADTVKEAAMGYFANWPEDGHMIGVADLFAKMDAGEEMLILDVRQPDAYAEGHLKGAVNVPFGPTLAESLSKIPDDVQLYVNCYTGQTSSQTVALLNMAGKYATNIQKGWNNGISKEEGYESYTETTANELSGDEYEVDPAMQEAVTKYFADMESSSYKYFNFPADQLKELVEAESEDYTILSIRQAKDFEAGHIAGAINVPFGANMQEGLTAIDTAKPVIIYCYTGQTASQTLAVMRLLGYEAYNLSGGMGSAESESGWLGIGGEVVTG